MPTADVVNHDRAVGRFVGDRISQRFARQDDELLAYAARAGM
jgi:hypothetical protein